MGLLCFANTKILGPPLFESCGTQSANTYHQIFRLASVELTVLGTRNSGRPCGLVGVGSYVSDREAKQFGKHEADFELGIWLRGRIMEDRGD
jgi:hypothetical protein